MHTERITVMFNPKPNYDITFDSIQLKDFNDYWEEFVVRPPYQRKSVWSRKKQQALLDSLFRRFYVPRIVVREIRISEEKTRREVIDGQQRITTAKLFFSDELPLPKSLADVSPEFPGKRYSDLSVEHRRFADRELKYNADIVKGIDDPTNREHQRIAAEIFWRLQQGESLTYMEIAHARLSSLSRNFVVKFADDISFDYANYKPVDGNKDKHRFFALLDRKNDRMQHLALLTRFLMIEAAEGPTDIKDTDLMEYIDRYQADDGIGNMAFESKPEAQSVLRALHTFFDIFKADPMVSDGSSKMKELRTEYFIISLYMLLRHLLRYYVFDQAEKELFREFTLNWHGRWRKRHEGDEDAMLFADNRQQTGGEIGVRDRIVRQAFFSFAQAQGHDMLSKDERRTFNEAERIEIYRRHNGMCQECLAEGKPEKNCIVPWSEYEADHVFPHSRGGQTAVWNGQVLCKQHNASKGAKQG